MIDILVQLLQDPEIIQMLIDLFWEVFLPSLGVSAAWIARARKVVGKKIPLMVMKAVVDIVRRHKDSGQPGAVHVYASSVEATINRAATEKLGKKIVMMPSVSALLTSVTKMALNDIDNGKPPADFKKLSGGAALKVEMGKVGAAVDVGIGNNIDFGGGVTYDWKNDKVDWATEINVHF